MTSPYAIAALVILMGSPLAIGISIYFWPRHADETPEGIDCIFCHVEQPVTGLWKHMTTRGRCKDNPFFRMTHVSTQRRRW